MTPVHHPDTIAFEAAAALDSYDTHMALLLPGGTPEQFARAGRDLHRVCAWCMHLPALSASSISLLLSHYRLLAALGAPPGEGLLQSRQRAHQACVERLRRACRGLFVAQHLH